MYNIIFKYVLILNVEVSIIFFSKIFMVFVIIIININKIVIFFNNKNFGKLIIKIVS